MKQLLAAAIICTIKCRPLLIHTSQKKLPFLSILLIPISFISCAMNFHEKFSMDDSYVDENIDYIDGIFKNSDTKFKSQENLVDFIESSLLVGADKLLFTQKSQKPFKKTTAISNYDMQFSDDMALSSALALNSSSLTFGIEPFDIVAFVTLMVMKLALFQLDLVMGFLRFPFKLLNLWLTVLMFPFRTLTLAKNHLKQKLVTLSKNCFMFLMSFIFERLKIHKSILRLCVRICWAIFWAIYVWFLLVGLLILGFVIGGISMRFLVQEPIKTTETLNFDYTKPSPVAFVPITSSPVAASGGDRSLPYNHRLKLSVSLTMPESDYNTNLGVFQVRVEGLSTDGKVTASFTNPSMLQYKSKPIKHIETIFKIIPLLTGFQAEVQDLKVAAIDFKEGIEPTACFKVTIEQRARFEPGFGIPEIYGASMRIETQLPKLKRFMWNWRRSVFVWLSSCVFLMEVAIFVVFCRPIIFPGKALSKIVGAKGKSIKSH